MRRDMPHQFAGIGLYMAKKAFGACTLCLNEHKLCHSHILPEFMYGKSYDDDGTFISLSNHPHRRPRPFQVGAREHLLCTECEAHLSSYEAYAAQLLRSIDAIPYEGQKGVEVEYDYHKFKLFGISLLWRSHVSTLHEYQDFSVGPLAAEMRRMLLNDDPGLPRMCPFAIMRYVGSEVAQHTMHVPKKLKQNGQHMAFFPAFGYSWYFVVSRRSHTVPDSFPLVGFVDKLIVPFQPTTDERFLAWLKSKIPPEML